MDLRERGAFKKDAGHKILGVEYQADLEVDQEEGWFT